MNKNVIIGILCAACAVSMIFGFLQRAQMVDVVEACEQEKLELIKTAQEQQLKAREFQKMAEQAQTEAMVQRALAEAQIEELKKKK